MNYAYTYIFLCHCIDKYERLMLEATTKEQREFAEDSYLMYMNKLELLNQ